MTGQKKERELAFEINAHAAQILSIAAKNISCRLIHLSSDFVFDGLKSTPYLPGDPVSPLSVYGKSKAKGESLIRKQYAANTIIIRTSWVYSVTGRNFVKSMLNLMKEQELIKVVF